MKFSIKYDKNFFKYAKSLEMRIKRVIEAYPRDAALWYFEEVVRRLPEGEYKSTISPFKSDYLYGVSLAKKEKVERFGTLVYMTPAKGTPPSKIAVFLQKYAPWTPDTLPDLPASMKSLVTFKQVTPQQEKTRGRDLVKHRYNWEREMLSIGLKPNRHRKRNNNLAAEGVAREFGFGERANPHWIPALRRLEREYGMILKSKLNLASLTKPRNSTWKKVPTWQYREINQTTVLQYEAFIQQVVRKL